MLTIIFLLLILLKAVTYAWAFQLHVAQILNGFLFCWGFFMKTTCIAVIVVYQGGLHQNYHLQGFHQTAIKICPRVSMGKSTPFPTPVLCRSRALAPVYHPFTFRIQLESIGSRPDINPCRGMPTTSQSKVTLTLP